VSPAAGEEDDLPIFNGHRSHPEFEEAVISELHLPSSTVYSLAVIGPMLLPWDAKDWGTLARRAWATFERTYLVMIYGMTLQVFVLVQLGRDVFTETNKCSSETYWSLKIACNSVFTAYVLQDIFDTWRMFKWLLWAPGWKRGYSCLEMRQVCVPMQVVPERACVSCASRCGIW
jgi:hypothetical protein